MNVNIRSLNLKPHSVNEEERKVTATIASEKPVLRWYDCICDEILPIEAAEIPEKCPLLNSHDRYDIKNIIGIVNEFEKTEDSTITATLNFSKTVNEEYDKVVEGVISSCSIGYQIDEFTIVQKGDEIELFGKVYEAKERPLVIATKWKILETSLVAVPADTNCQIKSLNLSNSQMINKDMNNDSNNNDTQRSITMKEEEKKEVFETKSPEEIRAEEKAKVKEILASCRSLKLGDDFAQSLIDSDKTVDECRAEIIKESAKALEKISAPEVMIKSEKSGDFKNVAELGLLASAGVKLSDSEKEQLDKAGVRGVTLQGLARKALEKSGISTSYMSNYEVANSVFSRGVSGDFTSVLANVARKASLTSFQNVNASYRQWAKIKPLSNFQSTKLADLGRFGYQADVDEGASPETASIGDVGVDIQLKKKHSSYVLSLEAIANDDLSMFADIPRNFAIDVVSSVNKDFYDYIKTNTDTIFTSGNSNIEAGTLDISGLDKAYVGLMSQTQNNVSLNYQPRFLICAPSDFPTAKQLVASTVDPSNANGAANIYQNGLTVITDGNLVGEDYFIVASDIESAGMVVGTLNGYDEPVVNVRQAMAGESAGVIYDCKYFYAVTAGNVKAMYQITTA